MYQSGFAYDYITAKMKDPSGPDPQRLGAMGFGAVVAGLLIFARHRFSVVAASPHRSHLPARVGDRRPIRPLLPHLGSPKWVLIKVGGQSLYERGKPFFIGLVVGHLAGYVLYIIAAIILYPGEAGLHIPPKSRYF